MNSFSKPDDNNHYLAEHIDLLIGSFFYLTGMKLIDDSDEPATIARKIYYAPFALVSHNTMEDPVFNYANETALKLFEMSWDEFTALPSRKSAEPLNRQDRARLLMSVTEKGYIDDYSGVRISSDGKRFRINNAIVWNVIDRYGNYRGQAAKFDDWEFL